MKMTKNEIREYAANCGCSARYSGKTRRFYFRKRFRIKTAKIHEMINSRL